MSLDAVPATMDGDRDVDLDDYAVLGGCLTARGGGIDPGCAPANLHPGADIDLADFAAFQMLYDPE